MKLRLCYDARMHELPLKIVRQTFEFFVAKGKIFQIPYGIPPELSKLEKGVFVAAFEKHGFKPRGRVGAIFPTKPNLALEIQEQTVRLAKTHHFSKHDLPFLSYELLFIRTPYLLADISHLKPESGLLIRLSTGKTVYSLPIRQDEPPRERLNEICRRDNVDLNTTSHRLYQFDVEKLNESHT